MEGVYIVPEKEFRALQDSIARIEENQTKNIADLNREFLYTNEEVCEMFKVSKKTTEIWRVKKAIGFIQINTLIRYRKTDIIAFCEKFGTKPVYKGDTPPKSMKD